MTAVGDILRMGNEAYGIGGFVVVTAVEPVEWDRIEEPAGDDVARWPVEGAVRCVAVRTRPAAPDEIPARLSASDPRRGVNDRILAAILEGR
jgi:hypothetical protein